jgi:L-iditol 2-dehydrogenase
MKACVLHDTACIEVREIPRPVPLPHQVLIRVEVVGICGTDAHIFAGHSNYNSDAAGRPIPLSVEPQIMGHEICGRIEDVGEGVRDLHPGELVAVDQGLNCVSRQRSTLCEYCRSGDSHQCQYFGEHGITGLQGGLAEFIAVPASNAIRIGAELEILEGALVEPLGCIIHASQAVGRAGARFTIRHPDPERQVRHILVCGAGPAGLLFLQYLRRVSEFEGLLLVAEPNPIKRKAALRFGADEVLDPASCDLGAAVRQVTGGRGVEFLIEASGQGKVFASIPQFIRKQATVLVYGHGHAGVDLSVLNSVMYKEPVLVTPVGASGGLGPDGRPQVYQQALHLIEERTIQVAPLVSHRYTGLETVQKALSQDMHMPDYVKGVVMPL